MDTAEENMLVQSATMDRLGVTPRLSIPGGAGTYSAIGARVHSPPPKSHGVGWIVDAGSDFPHELRSTIDGWQTGVLVRARDGLTTKGWNGYGANEHRAFRYLTPKLRLTAADLSTSLLRSKSFHLICSPLRCIELVAEIKARRASVPDTLPPPVFIWEPVPDLCVPAELDNTVEALNHVDVISPNHAELADLCGVTADTEAGHVDHAVVETCARRLLDSVASAADAALAAVVVRSGKDGCLVATASRFTWLPAFHASSPQKVIDPTGGGNGFLGGFAVGLVRTGDAVEAARWANVSASFCIEQVGVPVLKIRPDGKETWNGVVVEERLREALR
ncbi:hypothetical protein MBLNU459_g7677t2 [Dothideomycetes sp. NU459]